MSRALPPFRFLSVVRGGRLAVAATLAATMALSGCDALKKLLPAPTPQKGTSTEDVKPASIADPHLQIQLLTVHIQGPTELGDGKSIVADRQGQPAPTASASPAKAFGVLQAATPDLPVENAFVGIHGYDFKVIPQLPNRYSGPDGTTYFKFVPARIAFFLDAEISIKGKINHLLGLTRTPEEGLNSEVTVDLASTLVARELLRIWQMTNYTVSYRDLSPKDFNPLLATVRSVLRAGVPADLTLDLTTVAPPSGDWSLAADKQDGALLFLSKLAERQSAVDSEIGRLYQAVNFSLCNCHDASKIQIKRPDPL